MTKKAIFEKYKDRIKKKLKEANVTGNVAGFLTPNAFTRKPPSAQDKKKEQENKKGSVGSELKPTNKHSK